MTDTKEIESKKVWVHLTSSGAGSDGIVASFEYDLEAAVATVEYTLDDIKSQVLAYLINVEQFKSDAEAQMSYTVTLNGVELTVDGLSSALNESGNMGDSSGHIYLHVSTQSQKEEVQEQMQEQVFEEPSYPNNVPQVFREMNGGANSSSSSDPPPQRSLYPEVEVKAEYPDLEAPVETTNVEMTSSEGTETTTREPKAEEEEESVDGEKLKEMIAFVREKIHPNFFNQVVPRLVETIITLAAAAEVTLSDMCTCALLDLKACCEGAAGVNGSMGSTTELMERERLIVEAAKHCFKEFMKFGDDTKQFFMSQMMQCLQQSNQHFNHFAEHAAMHMQNHMQAMAQAAQMQAQAEEAAAAATAQSQVQAGMAQEFADACCNAGNCGYKVNSNPDYKARKPEVDHPYCCTACRHSNGKHHGPWCERVAHQDTSAQTAPVFEQTESVPEEPKPVHYNVTCDICNCHPIVGKRYKHSIRPDYDLCEDCFNSDTFNPIPERVNYYEVPAGPQHGNRCGMFGGMPPFMPPFMPFQPPHIQCPFQPSQRAHPYASGEQQQQGGVGVQQHEQMKKMFQHFGSHFKNFMSHQGKCMEKEWKNIGKEMKRAGKQMEKEAKKAEKEAKKAARKVEKELKNQHKKMSRMFSKEDQEEDQDSKRSSGKESEPVISTADSDIDEDDLYDEREAREAAKANAMHTVDVVTPEEASVIKAEDMHDDEKLLSIHPTIACDGCDAFPLYGIRYKCKVVDNTDLCEACFAKLVPQQRDAFEAIGFNKTKKQAMEEEKQAEAEEAAAVSESTQTPRESAETSEPEAEEIEVSKAVEESLMDQSPVANKEDTVEVEKEDEALPPNAITNQDEVIAELMSFGYDQDLLQEWASMAHFNDQVCGNNSFRAYMTQLAQLYSDEQKKVEEKVVEEATIATAAIATVEVESEPEVKSEAVVQTVPVLRASAPAEFFDMSKQDEDDKLSIEDEYERLDSVDADEGLDDSPQSIATEDSFEFEEGEDDTKVFIAEETEEQKSEEVTEVEAEVKVTELAQSMKEEFTVVSPREGTVQAQKQDKAVVFGQQILGDVKAVSMEDWADFRAIADGAFLDSVLLGSVGTGGGVAELLIRNSSDKAWPEDAKLALTFGDGRGFGDLELGPVSAGEMVKITLDFPPLNAQLHSKCSEFSFWTFSSASEGAFGTMLAIRTYNAEQA